MAFAVLLWLNVLSCNGNRAASVEIDSFGTPSISHTQRSSIYPISPTLQSWGCAIRRRSPTYSFLSFKARATRQTMETITAPPTLPANWQPTVSACLSSSDYWLWDYGSESDRWVVLGGPSQTTDCLPTPWASDAVFSGVQCPQKYTSACQGTDSHSEVTCCPKYSLLLKQVLRPALPRRC